LFFALYFLISHSEVDFGIALIHVSSVLKFQHCV
jgi:hypothetical protein